MKKTGSLMMGIVSGIAALGIAGCSNNLPEKPKDKNCNDFEWDYDDGVYECEDKSSHYYGHSYFNGTYFSNKAALKKSTSYKNYKSSSSFKGSSGFGSGSKSFGG
ncbi:aminotransferase yhxA [Priestia filamentosa]|uniref:hypothetical protein n=1 Tax=Priestia filamentosa TaxID=1402861 RepID=UPI0005894020